MEKRTVLVTGATGFIGYHVTPRLLAQGREVLGVDSRNNYYDPTLKGRPRWLLKRCAVQLHQARIGGQRGDCSLSISSAK